MPCPLPRSDGVLVAFVCRFVGDVEVCLRHVAAALLEGHLTAEAALKADLQVDVHLSAHLQAARNMPHIPYCASLPHSHTAFSLLMLPLYLRMHLKAGRMQSWPVWTTFACV